MTEPKRLCCSRGLALRLTPRLFTADQAGTVGRRRTEAFIEAIYGEAYASRIPEHYPTLISLQDEDGAIHAAVGYRDAGRRTLFLEQYLDAPVEDAVSAVLDIDATRDTIVEIGGLASASRGASVHLFHLLVQHLSANGARVAVATATRTLRSIFHRTGLETGRLAAADPNRLSDRGAAWGAYYDTDPEVLAGRIPTGGDQIDRFLRTAPLGQALQSRFELGSLQA